MLIFTENVRLPMGARESELLYAMRIHYMEGVSIMPVYATITPDEEGESFTIDVEIFYAK